jgi:3-phosphoshikimate 1-carboxyvinyltransferase
VPGDKSISHRAVIFGALASGRVEVSGLGDGADNRGTARAFAAMGVAIDARAGGLGIAGVGLDGLRAPATALDVGNSGTTIRLLSGLLCAQPFGAALTGDDSLQRRPMRRVIDPLARMGAVIDGTPGARPGELYPPLRIAPAPGGLRGIDYALPIASAQVKSALLLAGLYAAGPTRLVEPGPSRDHTERMLAYLGAPVRSEPGGVTVLDPRDWDRRLAARPFDVPGDPSSAAFLVAAALVAGAAEVRVLRVCVNPTRVGFIDALLAMGVVVELANRAEAGGEPVADLVVRGPSPALRAAELGGDLVVRCIDEIPVLAVVAAMGEGTTWFRDAAELRVKESDRIATTAAMLRAFGVEAIERADALGVVGRGGARLLPARVDAVGDHRIAMSAAIAALAATGETVIDDVACVATSYPAFVADLTALGAELAEA